MDYHIPSRGREEILLVTSCCGNQDKGKDYLSQVAHQAGAYPTCSSIKRIGVFLLPPKLDAQNPQIINLLVPIYAPGWREVPLEYTVKFLAQEHNTMSLVRAGTWTTHSGVDCTNHDATMPPMNQDNL